jgi:multidrug/hemolysin transport system ATP-binding protein
LLLFTENVFGQERRESVENIIEISHLDKRFGDVHAVQDLSFRVKEGELFAFLGVNGAGKSTTINIMCAQLAKDSGTVLVNGVDLDKNADAVKADLGVVFQTSGLDKALTVRDNLKSRAALYGITGKAFDARLAELSQLLELEKLLKRTLGKLSGGQKRRVDIARALLHQPKILILDEPTTGLDPQTRRAVWEVVDQLRRERGMTVFLTTHYMEEAADADYVVILDSGKIAAEGTPLQLKNTYTGDFITLYNATPAQIAALGVAGKTETIRDAIRIAVLDTEAATKLIVAHPDIFTDYEITKGKMDDVFLSVTGKKLTGGEGK